MKKILLLALLIAFVLALGACGRAGDPEPAITPAPATPTPPPAPTPTPPPPEEDLPDEVRDIDEWIEEDLEGFLIYHFPPVDLGGVTVRLGGMGTPYVENPEVAATLAERRERVERLFNVVLCFDNFDVIGTVGAANVAPTFIESVAAGDPFVNIFSGQSAYHMPGMVIGGAVVALDDAVRGFFPETYYRVAGELFGNVWGFSRVPMQSPHVFIYNRELIVQAGMTYTPQEMFLQGRWSLEDYYEYLVELAALLPPDVVPSGMHPDFWMRYGATSNAGYMVNPATNFPGILEEGFLEHARMLQRLVQEGLHIQPGWLSHEEGSAHPVGNWSWGAAFIGGSHEDLFYRQETVFLSTQSPNLARFSAVFEFGVVPPPWGSNITFPESGNWRELKSRNPGMYNSLIMNAVATMLIEAGPSQLTPEAMRNLVFMYEYPNAIALVRNRILMEQGLPVEPVVHQLHTLWTDLDVEIMEWYLRDPMYCAVSNAGMRVTNWGLTWWNALGDGTDLRAAFEGLMPELIWNMYNRGTLLREDIPAEWWLQAEEFGANIDEE